MTDLVLALVAFVVILIMTAIGLVKIKNGDPKGLRWNIAACLIAISNVAYQISSVLLS